MKKLFGILTALLLTAGVAAQNPTAYFMEGSTFRSQLNPAYAPLRGYINIPGLGGVNLNTSGNLSLDNVLFPRNGKLVTLFDSSVSANAALGGLNAQNLLGADTRINLIGFGAFARNQKDFWSFDLNIRTTADANLPYELFEFLKLGSSVDIRNIGLCADSYLEAGFNYSFPVGERLYLGVRGKFLMGIARTKMQYDHFRVSLLEEQWKVNASGQFDITGAGLEITPNDENLYQPGDINLRPTAPAGYGFALDLGATYDILPNLQASLAVTDLGMIAWSKKNTGSGLSVDELYFSGIDIEDGVSSPQPDFDFNLLEFTPTAPRGTTRMLRASINAGLEYNVWRHKIGFGVLYSARIWEYKTLHNITGSVNFHPIRWFTLTGSYSVIDNRGGAFGLAMNLNPNWINFYIATDILTAKHTPQFIPIKQSTMNITLGLGIPIGKRSHRVSTYIYPKDKR